MEIRAPCRVFPLSTGAPEEGRDALFGRAMAKPAGGRSLEDFLTGVRRLLVIVNDATRATPTAWVLSRLGSGVLSHPDVTFLVGCGSHRPPTEEEMGRIFGDALPGVRDRAVAHDADDAGAMVTVGTTSRGTPVSLNRLALECDGHILIGSTKPHYFAGFTGGRKAYLPGIASRDTIVANHSHALSASAMPMRVEGNPLAEDMEEAMGLLGGRRAFAVELVLTPEREVHSVHCGDPDAAFRSAVESARGLYSMPLGRKGNIVITANPHPFDMHLYQSQHALENGWLALRPPGVLILVSRCWDGVGPDSFLGMTEEVRKLEETGGVTRGHYRLGMHKPARLLRMSREARLMAVTGLDPAQVARAGLEPFADIRSAVDEALGHVRRSGNEPDVIVMPHGGLTVPVHQNNNEIIDKL